MLDLVNADVIFYIPEIRICQIPKKVVLVLLYILSTCLTYSGIISQEALLINFQTFTFEISSKHIQLFHCMNKLSFRMAMRAMIQRIKKILVSAATWLLILYQTIMKIQIKSKSSILGSRNLCDLGAFFQSLCSTIAAQILGCCLNMGC